MRSGELVANVIEPVEAVSDEAYDQTADSETIQDSPESQAASAELLALMEEYADQPMAMKVRGVWQVTNGSYDTLAQCVWLQGVDLEVALLKAVLQAGVARYLEGEWMEVETNEPEKKDVETHEPHQDDQTNQQNEGLHESTPIEKPAATPSPQKAVPLVVQSTALSEIPSDQSPSGSSDAVAGDHAVDAPVEPAPAEMNDTQPTEAIAVDGISDIPDEQLSGETPVLPSVESLETVEVPSETVASEARPDEPSESESVIVNDAAPEFEKKPGPMIELTPEPIVRDIEPEMSVESVLPEAFDDMPERIIDEEEPLRTGTDFEPIVEAIPIASSTDDMDMDMYEAETELLLPHPVENLAIELENEADGSPLLMEHLDEPVVSEEPEITAETDEIEVPLGEEISLEAPSGESEQLALESQFIPDDVESAQIEPEQETLASINTLLAVLSAEQRYEDEAVLVEAEIEPDTPPVPKKMEALYECLKAQVYLSERESEGSDVIPREIYVTLEKMLAEAGVDDAEYYARIYVQKYGIAGLIDVAQDPGLIPGSTLVKQFDKIAAFVTGMLVHQDRQHAADLV